MRHTTKIARIFWPADHRGFRPGRVRFVIWASLWVLLRLPVAVPDFHAVEHHHSDGADCLFHDHLNRWHGPCTPGEPPETESATFHWHWVIPGSSVPSDRPPASDESGESEPIIPTLSDSAGNDFLSRLIECTCQNAKFEGTGTSKIDDTNLSAASLFDYDICFVTPRADLGAVSASPVGFVFSPVCTAIRPLRC